ncbi:hypothetical protein [Acinetobacter sp. YH01008]|uniref:hypothetical protein n=1 Tax=Acinetobacter sp. YH01008 TaxID=2601024 RepID=UPI0015D28D9C|nr:hypothetical protein [Acinetobacter sp. YH01008]
MQDIVLCSQLTSRHGLLVGLTETKKTVTLIYEQSVDRNSAFEMLQNPSGRTSKNAKQAEFAKQQAKEQ